MDTDVLIIGSGASGAAVAWRLSQAGIRTICLEQGDWLRNEDIPSSRPDWEVTRLTWWSPNPNIRRAAADYPIDDSATPIKPLMYNGVGGSTIMWFCFNPRFRPDDFRVRSLDGVADDWPLTYDELEPYYDLSDRMMGVSGLAGDRSVPPRRERPMPPPPLNRSGQKMAAAYDKLGWHWWPADVARNAVPYQGRAACNYCGPCEMGCPHGAKGSADVTYWPAALQKGAELRTGARVFEITTDASGKATGALYFDRDGAVQRVTAGAVVMAANGIGTPRLLLLSKSPAHPDGLANSSGLVGKNLMHHPIAAVMGVLKDPFETGTGATGASILSNQFYGTKPGCDFVRGYMLAGPRVHFPLGTVLGGMIGPIGWGARHHGDFERVFGHTGNVIISAEDLPRESNTVTLATGLTDADGIPAPKLTYALDDNSKKMIRHAIDRSKELWAAAGTTETYEMPLLSQAGFHLMGTARMGNDRARSVVDRWGRAHDVPNLFIVDGSVFVTAAAVNPTPTIQALALRTADHIIASRG